MKATQRGCMLLLVVIGCAASICFAVPIQNDSGVNARPKNLRAQLFETASPFANRVVQKRSHHYSPLAAAEQEYQAPEYEEEASNNPVEGMFAQLSTEELLRMLELLDMLETRQPIKASDQEMATLQYLLKNYQN